MRRCCAITLAALAAAAAGRAAGNPECSDGNHRSFDVIVYGSTPGGIAAAIAAANSAARPSVLLLSPTPHIGGMMSGGLGHTDKGNVSVIGGLARTFFRKVCEHYGSKDPDGCFEFEPHVAETILESMLASSPAVRLAGDDCEAASFDRAVSGRGTGLRGAWLSDQAREPAAGAAAAPQQSLRSVTTAGGSTFAASVFVDASYEGDLLVGSGADAVWGREGRAAFNESMAGRLPMPEPYANPENQFGVFVNATAPGGGVLPLVWPGSVAAVGDGDNRTMAYTFRLCMTDDPSNTVPLPDPPGGYDPARFELLRRYIRALPAAAANSSASYWMPSSIPGRKLDVNNRGAVSTDFILGSWTYPTATPAERRAIAAAHADYILGLLRFLRTDPAVPQAVRSEISRWGLAKDEFADSPIVPHWPYQLYVRECVRLRGAHVFSQADRTTDLGKADSVAVGSYNIDVHNGQRFMGSETGRLVNEGNFDRWGPTKPDAKGSFDIPFRALVPRDEPSQPSNVLSPVCASATHVGYGALRLEPQYMAMGQAAGVAAAMAWAGGVAVQRVDVQALQAELVAAGQIIHR